LRMSDQTGLMAPIPSRVRAEHDSTIDRERGLLGLLRAIGGPISVVPGPVGAVADVASQVGEKGIGPGLLSAASDAVMGQVTRPAKAIRNVIAVPKHTGDPATRMTLPSSGVEFEILTDKDRLRPLATTYAASMRQPVEFALADLYDNPAFFERYPKLAGMGVNIHAGQSPEGLFNPTDKRIAINYQDLEGPHGLKGMLSHELTHAVADATGNIPQGTNPDAMIQRMEMMKAMKNGDPVVAKHLAAMELAEARTKTEPGFMPYLLQEGEAMARVPQNMRDGRSVMFDVPRERMFGQEASGTLLPPLQPFRNPAEAEKLLRALQGR
jgi:hypothetical protein